jgi:hypothetical protein
MPPPNFMGMFEGNAGSGGGWRENNNNNNNNSQQQWGNGAHGNANGGNGGAGNEGDMNGNGGGGFDQDWLALPLDPLLDQWGAEIGNSAMGPDVGGLDMLDILLNMGGVGGGG